MFLTSLNVWGLDISRRYNLVIGRVRTVLVTLIYLSLWRFARVTTVQLVITFAKRTYPSSPLKTSTTRANGHWRLRWCSSASKTRSSTLRFSFGSFHFSRSSRVGKYSLIHRFQNRFAKYCACLHYLQWRSSFSKIPGGTLAHGRSCKRWFGVRGSSSMGSSLFRVNGLLFRM